ncbi:hypothetical protein A2W14_01740 [Candidatus Gottesmanbacteria bacterium RBG_16_37_8]|uniref:Glycosyltransferase RgtA/B/C/D-like domain-containing protein n=1 Tax=Candidatus Gottesmanbacteria bacterium RBG_16_37_8 TaxID=1798371 RepID=A0A1F5YQM6_9BACT|nr:MAG: hypothetical protein A2W14_01740 [Candidatus Gottesmanbacteria bacterium RBG_16_37_8]
MSGIILLNIFLYFFYNYIRFNNPLETGQSYIIENPHFEIKKILGSFNLKYLFHNSYYFLINPLKLRFSYPYISPDPQGNSIFFTSPLFFLLFGIIANGKSNKNRSFLYICLFTAGFIILSFIFYSSTGWIQFGYRYALGIIPFLILALAWVIGDYSKIIVMTLFILSVIFNTIGAFWMLQINSLLNY